MTDKIHAQTLKLLDELRAIRAQSSSPSDAMSAMKVPLDALLEMYPDVHAAVHGKPAVEHKATEHKADKPADKPVAEAKADKPADVAPAAPAKPAAGAFHFSGEATPSAKPPA